MAAPAVYILVTAIAALIFSACAAEPTSTFLPTPLPPAALATTEKAVNTREPRVQTVVRPVPKVTPTPIIAAARHTPSNPVTITSAPTPPPILDATSTLADTPAPTAMRTALPVPTPPTEPTQVPTPVPTPVVHPCRAPYDSLIVSGPSEPAKPQNRDSVFRSLTVDPTDPDVVILGTERNGLVKSIDGGLTWTRLRAGLRSGGQGYSEVWDIDISTSNPNVIMAAILDSPGPPSGPRVAAGLYRSEDGGESWVQLNCGFTTSRVVSVRMDPSNPDVAVAGLEGGFPSYTGDSKYYPGGIFRTEDAGQNWNRVELGPNDHRNGFPVMQVIPTSPPQIITFGLGIQDPVENLGFIRTFDMGRTWEQFALELKNRRIHNFTVSHDGRVIYADESDTYFGHISRDGGETWTRSAIVQVNGPIAVSPADDDLVIFSSFYDVRRSTNALSTVGTVMEPPLPVREIVFAPSDPNVVYAETNGYALYRSDDAGLTWRQLVDVRNEVLNVQP